MLGDEVMLEGLKDEGKTSPAVDVDEGLLLADEALLEGSCG